ncbi:MAG: 5-bromo-4-chloroindolyl phosphate hydrolysis family protein [Clostridia bacterium]|nr:5-bromo-4-chloroindolyl phosphate hydrolysis family protein [Clostridia bacterium]
MAPSKKRRNKRGVSGSYIIMGIIALAYSGVFPLFGIFHIAKFAFTVWAVGKVFKMIVRKMHAKEDAEAERLEEEERMRKAEERKAKRLENERKRAEAQKNSTGIKEVDELLLRGQELLLKIRLENERLPDPEISDQIDTIESISNQIFKCVIEQPEKADQIQRFMEYYLPTTLKMLTAYRRMEENNATGAQAEKTQQRIRNSLTTIIEAFQKQLNQLFEEEAFDIATDIDVMETMLKQDGLIDSGLKVRTSTGEEKIL